MPALSSAALMATTPRSAAEKSLSEPSSRPIGVRAPLTMTERRVRVSVTGTPDAQDERGTVRLAVGGVLLLAGGDLLGGLGDDGVQVADDAEVGQLEDRGLGVLVDGHDGLRGLHAGAVLDRTGDADGDVELRGDGLAGLPHLEAVGVEAGVHG